MKRRYVTIWILIFIIGCTGCGRENITDINPERGLEQTENKVEIIVDYADYQSYTSVEDLEEQSECIVYGEILSRESSWMSLVIPDYKADGYINPGGDEDYEQGVVTVYEVKVIDTYKTTGNDKDVIKVMMRGGETPEAIYRVEGNPEIEIGNEYVLFLHKSSILENGFWLLNNTQSLYSVDGDRISKTNDEGFELSFAKLERLMEETPRESFSEKINNMYKEESKYKGSLDVPMYDEELLFDVDSGFELVRDAGLWAGTSAMPTGSAGIIGTYPTEAIRLKDCGTVYTVYDVNTGYRLYLFFDKTNNYIAVVGFPIVIKEVLSFSDFEGLSLGDSIELVEAIDPVATLHKRYIQDVWHLDHIGAKGMAEYGFPCTSIHYLKDGLLRIEYDMLEDGSLVVSRIELNKDYILTDALGNKIDCRIEETDLP